MVRRTCFVLAATLLVALAAPAVPAIAGGGCHARSTTGTGDTVEMAGLCFTPTTLRVDPGATVTFVNRDATAHNVLGTGWGTGEELLLEDAFTATFADAGIFPYACSYHPGMTGAIVVGSGDGVGNGEQVSVVAFEPVAPSPAVEIRTVAAEPGGGGSAIGWIGGGGAGLLVGLGAGLAIRRRSARAGSEV
ncbi:MAG: plastocyanin/azurin family copper-binding protein [Actinomycetota bacterium]